MYVLFFIVLWLTIHLLAFIFFNFHNIEDAFLGGILVATLITALVYLGLYNFG